MNATKTSASLLLLSLPLLGFIAREDKVSFHPTEGASVEKELSLELTFYMDDMSVVMDGNEMPIPPQGLDQAVTVNAVMSVTDEYVKSKTNKILTLLRSYDELSLEAGLESESENVDKFADLEGSTIAFAWDEETGEYTKTYHDSDGEEELLENLDVDMDFLVLLPDDEVSEGDTWEASGETLATIFLPGGLVIGSSGEAMDETAEELSELVKEELGGQLESAFEDFVIKCTYGGTRDEDGTDVGVIAFVFEGSTDLDLTELILAAIDLNAGEIGLEADITATVSFEFDGEGTLLWDMKGGHVQGFEMEGEIIMTVDIEGDVDVMGESHSFEMSAEASGEANWSLTTSTSDDGE